MNSLAKVVNLRKATLLFLSLSGQPRCYFYISELALFNLQPIRRSRNMIYIANPLGLKHTASIVNQQRARCDKRSCCTKIPRPTNDGNWQGLQIGIIAVVVETICISNNAGDVSEPRGKQTP